MAQEDMYAQAWPGLQAVVMAMPPAAAPTAPPTAASVPATAEEPLAEDAPADEDPYPEPADAAERESTLSMSSEPLVPTELAEALESGEEESPVEPSPSPEDYDAEPEMPLEEEVAPPLEQTTRAYHMHIMSGDGI